MYSYRCNYCASTSQKHTCHKNIGEETKNHKDDVGHSTVTSTNDFQESMCIGSASFQFNGDCGE